MTLRDIEKQAIIKAVLSESHISRAAELLGVPRSTIYRKLKSYGLCKGNRVMVGHLLEQLRKLQNVPRVT